MPTTPPTPTPMYMIVLSPSLLLLPSPESFEVGDGEGDVGDGEGDVGDGEGDVGDGEGDVGDGEGDVGDGEGFAPEQTKLPDESEQAFSSSPIPQRLGGFELQSMEA